MLTIAWDEERLEGDYTRLFKKRLRDDTWLTVKVSPIREARNLYEITSEEGVYTCKDEGAAVTKIREIITQHVFAIQEVYTWK